MLERIDTCDKNPKKSTTTEIIGYSLFTYCSVAATKNILDYYGGKDCIKKLL